MPDTQLVAQYGAVGVLILIVIGLGKLGLKVVDRWFKLADKIEAILDTYFLKLTEFEGNSERRHIETRSYIDRVAATNRDAVRAAVQDAQAVVVDTIRVEGAICRGEDPPRSYKRRTTDSKD